MMDRKPKLWPVFREKFPVRKKLFPPGEERDQLNEQLTNIITMEGDSLQQRSQAKCHMTRWNMHKDFYNFFLVGAAAIDFASRTPLALRTKENGEPDDIPMYIKETWGLIYGKGHKCDIHTHWPSLWSYTYCVNACSDCAPLVFSYAESDEEKFIFPQTGQMVIFPSWLNHEVPEHECDHDRIMIAGNLNTNISRDEVIVEWNQA